ncbi:TerD family protein, partial [Streptomyces sp. NPDC006385]|uniref:TerD family protein n=1 Tax=Streptomyces sp. NPDC006385 TaxID=3156761 RepID=UPI0033AC8BE1
SRSSAPPSRTPISPAPTRSWRGTASARSTGALLYDAAVADGDPLAYFDIKPETGQETALICGELYRRGEGWKFRALGEGYSNGLKGLATDYGISVDESEAAEEPAPAPEVSQPLPPEQPTTAVPAQPSYGYPQQPPATQPAYGYPQTTSQPATAPSGYGYPPPVTAAQPQEFRLPPQGPQFIGR